VLGFIRLGLSTADFLQILPFPSLDDTYNAHVRLPLSLRFKGDGTSPCIKIYHNFGLLNQIGRRRYFNDMRRKINEAEIRMNQGNRANNPEPAQIVPATSMSNKSRSKADDALQHLRIPGFPVAKAAVFQFDKDDSQRRWQEFLQCKREAKIKATETSESPGAKAEPGVVVNNEPTSERGSNVGDKDLAGQIYCDDEGSDLIVFSPITSDSYESETLIQDMK